MFSNSRPAQAGKLDAFAQALKDQGAQFYGAFWCPHCQDQKKIFGTSKQYLPYVECSNPNQSMNQLCIGKNIESYPTWTFRDGITVNSEAEPTVCLPKPGVEGEPAICSTGSSKNGKTWFFPAHKFSIRSATDPIREGAIWKFPADAATQGELPLEFLAQQIGFTLPE